MSPSSCSLFVLTATVSLQDVVSNRRLVEHESLILDSANTDFASICHATQGGAVFVDLTSFRKFEVQCDESALSFQPCDKNIEPLTFKGISRASSFTGFWSTEPYSHIEMDGIMLTKIEPQVKSGKTPRLVRHDQSMTFAHCPRRHLHCAGCWTDSKGDSFDAQCTNGPQGSSIAISKDGSTLLSVEMGSMTNTFDKDGEGAVRDEWVSEWEGEAAVEEQGAVPVHIETSEAGELLGLVLWPQISESEVELWPCRSGALGSVSMPEHN